MTAKGIAAIVGVAVGGLFGLGRLDANTVPNNATPLDAAVRNDAGEIEDGGGLYIYDTQVGDCFNVPPDQVGGPIGWFEAVPCWTPHENEVFAQFEVGPAGAYPGRDLIMEELWLGCFERFDAWVGLPYESSSLEIGGLPPSAQVWSEGHRKATCYVFDLNGQKLSISTKASGL